MQYQDKFPDLKTVRSLLIAEEMRLRTKALASPIDSSSHMVLMAQSGTNHRSSSQVKSSRPCFNFAKGSCRFGSNCRYVHDSNVKPPSSTPSIANNVTDELLMKLLEKLGLQSGSIVTSTTPPYASNSVALSPGPQGQPMMQMARLSFPPPGFNHPLAQSPTQAHLMYTTAGLDSAGPSLVLAQQQVQPPPAMVTAQPAQPDTSGPITTTGQATILPSAFTTGTLHDPSTGAWHMDSGATSHLNSSVYNLSDVFNTCSYSSISVGDGHTIPVTNSGHSMLPSHSRSLHLNNVLITPHIVKNLIFVRQFVRDNNCTVEFDAFGFSVKDFMTRQVLLRCDSTGDLYPSTAQSPIPQVLLMSQHTWHQRRGHPGSDVLRRLVSNKFISCNKEKSPVLYHACQLGKHVRLPVTACFDIIDSDVWTSPILSLSGYKYYVLFLDHYSQFVWAYPLINKSDVLSKFMLFRTYVRNQFKCEIKSFQCDHGGEFDNRTFHKLFVDNGIAFRFYCPKTSQQNGKSERMVRTINNLIRTLLFQANLPPTFWVEALNMAIYLLNILPSTAINNEILYTRLFAKNPDYSLIRTFGCLCYPHLYPSTILGCIPPWDIVALR
ncbi:ribonuclease H-like domain-containing protein [Tanacetum coccineum]